MKYQHRRIFIVLLLALALGAFMTGQVVLADANEQQVQFVAPRLVVNTSFLNVRTGPGVQYPAFITVVGGTELPVLGRASDNVWYQVSTVIGVGWVNVQFTVPRGSFDNVPVINLSDIVVPIVSSGTFVDLSIAAGQGGGGAPPSVVVANTVASPFAVTPSGTIRVELGNGLATNVLPGERYRAFVNVEAVNLFTQPTESSSTLGTLYLDRFIDYPILDRGRGDDVAWLAIQHPDLGVGWIPEQKLGIRLSRVGGDVMVVNATSIALTDSPNGSSGNTLPILSNGREGFLIDVNQGATHVKLDLGDGTQGWLPFSSVVGRDGTLTDLIDRVTLESLRVTVPVAAAAAPGTTVTTGVPVSDPSIPRVVVNTGFLNIRSGPGAQYSVVATVSGGTELPVIGIASDQVWYLVQGPFGRGWLNIEFGIFRGVIQSVPIIRDAAGILSNPVAVVSGSVTLYAAPGTNFGAIGTLTGPIEVAVVARTVDAAWYQLNTPLGFGWVPANQLVLRGDQSLVPVVG